MEIDRGLSSGFVIRANATIRLVNRFVDFAAMNRHIARSFDSESDLVATDFDDRDDDLFVDHDAFIRTSRENQHGNTPFMGVGQSDRSDVSRNRLPWRSRDSFSAPITLEILESLVPASISDLERIS